MNERGFASITAILILLMLAYLIRGTIFTAQNYADMTRNFELENRLQFAAESELENTIEHYKDFADLDAVEDQLSSDDQRDVDINGLNVKIRVARLYLTVYDENHSKENYWGIKILAVAKKSNYFAKGINAYRSVACFLKETTPTEGTGTYKYEFQGFLHSTI